MGHSGRFNRIHLANVGGFDPVDITTFSATQNGAYFQITDTLQVFPADDNKEDPQVPGAEEDHNIGNDVEMADIDDDCHPPEVNKHFLVYGEAGSGKSYLIRALMQLHPPWSECSSSLPSR